MSIQSAIQLSNSLTGKREVFAPATPGKVNMYVCGITPYDECHLGHARCYVFFDTVKRFLKAAGYEVRHVQNFTDIDDKIIQRAQLLDQDSKMISEKFIADYFTQMGKLGVVSADVYPKVTETVPQIIKFIEELIAKGFAYPVEGTVFFSVRNFKTYGHLSKRNFDDMEVGARVEVNEQKKDPLDFALWKAAKPGEPAWPSPWGEGRPGWHIECSVMSIMHLGESFDIHGGGQDLIFPHHENEIAQSEAKTGKQFSKVWLHNGFVTVNREKMSKSLGNFFTLREVFEKFQPPVVRLFLLSRHYKSPLDFSDDLLVQAQSAYRSLEDVYVKTAYVLDGKTDGGKVLEDIKTKFMKALAEDINTEKAIAVLFELNNLMIPAIKDRKLDWLRDAVATMKHCATDLLGIRLESKLTADIIRDFKASLARRDEFRKQKDWANADKVRIEIEAAGYAIEDTALGPILKPKR